MSPRKKKKKTTRVKKKRVKKRVKTGVTKQFTVKVNPRFKANIRKLLKGELKTQFKKETQSERWHRFYGNQTKLMEIVKPAYNGVVAPQISGIIDYFKKPSITVLVIGGGTGVFSRDLLPAVRKNLAKIGNRTRIKVVETDIVSIIKKAPQSAHRFRADNKALPFKNESFDLIVGQSMLHQGEIKKIFPEINRVMKPGGCLFHMQDAVPYSEKFAETARPILKNKKDSGKAIKSGHNLLLNRIIEQSHRHRLARAIIHIGKSAIVPREQKIGKVAGYDLDAVNTIHFRLGALKAYLDPTVPPGKRKVSYEGFMAIVTKGKASEIVKHIRHKFPKNFQ